MSSVLFGHVKGAFTGANEEKKGLLAEADGGYLFLDEVHNLSAENQEKLFIFMEKVEECVKLIRSLQPKPASGFVGLAPYLQCEVGVSVVGERLEVEILNNYEALQLCPEYYMEKDQKTQEFVRPYLQQINQLFDMLNARERTLCLIATEIVENQKDFFLKRGNRKPLTLREIAEQVVIVKMQSQRE